MTFEHAMLQADLGFWVARSGWINKAVTGNGEGGFILQDRSAYEASEEDSAAVDWSVK